MYAIIKTGGKQLKVEEGQTIYVEKLDAKAGDKVTFDEVIFVGGTSRRLVHRLLMVQVLRELLKSRAGQRRLLRLSTSQRSTSTPSRVTGSHTQRLSLTASRHSNVNDD